MQTFENYLKDIHMSENPELLDDDLPDDFDNWMGTLEQDTMIDYANDYAKDCMMIAREKIHEMINKNMVINYKEFGTNKHDWCYEECLEVVDNIEPRAKVINNNQKGWETIIEVKPFTTLMIDTELYTKEDLTQAYKRGQADAYIESVNVAMKEKSKSKDRVSNHSTYEFACDSIIGAIEQLSSNKE